MHAGRVERTTCTRVIREGTSGDRHGTRFDRFDAVVDDSRRRQPREVRRANTAHGPVAETDPGTTDAKECPANDIDVGPDIDRVHPDSQIDSAIRSADVADRHVRYEAGGGIVTQHATRFGAQPAATVVSQVRHVDCRTGRELEHGTVHTRQPHRVADRFDCREGFATPDNVGRFRQRDRPKAGIDEMRSRRQINIVQPCGGIRFRHGIDNRCEGVRANGQTFRFVGEAHVEVDRAPCRCE